MDAQERQLINEMRAELEAIEAGREEAIGLIKGIVNSGDVSQNAKAYLDALLDMLDSATGANMSPRDVRKLIDFRASSDEVEENGTPEERLAMYKERRDLANHMIEMLEKQVNG